jgi:hypothetical protein
MVESSKQGEFDKYNKVKELGRGAEGVVYLVTRKSDGMEFA